MDEPRACYTEWSNSERKKQIMYINPYIWNLEKWNQWTYLQGKNRDVDVDNRLVDTVGEEEGEMNWESRIDMQTSLNLGKMVFSRDLKIKSLWICLEAVFWRVLFHLKIIRLSRRLGDLYTSMSISIDSFYPRSTVKSTVLISLFCCFSRYFMSSFAELRLFLRFLMWTTFIYLFFHLFLLVGG